MYASTVTAFTHLYTCDLDLWPLTLKSFSALLIRVMNIYAKFHWNPSTKSRDIISCRIDVKWRMDGQRIEWRHTQQQTSSAAYTSMADAKKLYILAAREDTHSRNMTASLGQMIVRDHKRIVDVVVHRYVKKLKTWRQRTRNCDTWHVQSLVGHVVSASRDTVL